MDYGKELSNYVMEMHNKHGRDAQLSQLTNFEIDKLSKLVVQYRYGIPVSVIENYKRGGLNGEITACKY